MLDSSVSEMTEHPLAMQRAYDAAHGAYMLSPSGYLRCDRGTMYGRDLKSPSIEDHTIELLASEACLRDCTLSTVTVFDPDRGVEHYENRIADLPSDPEEMGLMESLVGEFGGANLGEPLFTSSAESWFF